MKQATLTILAAFVIHLAGFSQWRVTPAVGVGDIRIGMPMDSILKIIGEASFVLPYKDEKTDWEKAGYNPVTETVFTIPFDSVYVFNNSNDHAVWKIYAHEGRAVILNICKLVLGTEVLKNITTADGLGFNQDPAAIVKSMGNDYSRDPDKNENFVYRQKGISFILVNSKLNNMFIYKAGKKDSIDPCDGNENLYSITAAPVMPIPVF